MEKENVVVHAEDGVQRISRVFMGEKKNVIHAELVIEKKSRVFIKG